MELALPKGMQDSLPETQIPINETLAVLTDTFERYAFEPLETPAIEYREILTSKYAGGEEITREIYSLTDRGGRALSLRYDLTVPFARVFGMYRPPIPFKRYQIGKVWRDGPTGHGRYREFIQCDIDVIGIQSVLADAEIIAAAAAVFDRLEIPIAIRINHRRLLSGMAEASGISSDLAPSAILALDKLDKIGRTGVLDELDERGIGLDAAERFLELANQSGSNVQILDGLWSATENAAVRSGVDELRELTQYIEFMEVPMVHLSPSLARGLAYYTGTIVEIVATEATLAASVAGGGRYDNMVGDFLQDGHTYPAVGISFGLSRILDVLKERDQKQPTVLDAFVIPFAEQIPDALQLAQTLRAAGVRADFEKMPNRRLRDSLKFANRKGVRFVVIIGPDEVDKGVYKLRDMTTGAESLHTSEALVQHLQDQRG